ncbi:hypothetical protein [Facilibium subflavum]|uniref:hypothetical protein n=1 Tax=Facilibium subflavum TaxID=2219058 RepID=UPI0013C30067|nr:hypothetical protein [Facilibium subflavum]
MEKQVSQKEAVIVQKDIEFKRSEARKMLSMGVPISVICKVTGLSKSEVLSL